MNTVQRDPEQKTIKPKVSQRDAHEGRHEGHGDRPVLPRRSVRNQAAGLWDRLRRHKTGHIVIVFAVVQLICIAAALAAPEQFGYLRAANIETLLKSIPPLAILSVGVGILMIGGEFDLSVGSNFAIAAYIMAMLFNAGAPSPAAMLGGLAVGAFIGFLNGAITLFARIPSFIATLGTLMFWRGMLMVLSQGTTESFAPGSFMQGVFAGSFGWLQTQFIWAIAVGVGGYLLLERHKLGNHIFAVGGNRESAIAIGVNPGRVKMAAFIIVGTLAAFAGIISTFRVHSVSPEQGKGLELQAIAACVVGGVSLMGGQGSILGLFLGAALLFTITDVLLLLRAPGFYLDMFMGILIVAAVVFNRLTQRENV